MNDQLEELGASIEKLKRQNDTFRSAAIQVRAYLLMSADLDSNIGLPMSPNRLRLLASLLHEALKEDQLSQNEEQRK
jgi:hypothetical protein